jgi:hypothetical protein
VYQRVRVCVTRVRVTHMCACGACVCPAVHSIGLRRVSPMMLSSLASLLLTLIGASLRPVASQKIQASPPLCAHAGHGSGSPFNPSPTASPPKTSAIAMAFSLCAASNASSVGNTAVTGRSLLPLCCHPARFHPRPCPCCRSLRPCVMTPPTPCRTAAAGCNPALALATVTPACA